MENINDYTSEFILRTTDPTAIFKGDEIENKRIYKKLSLIWHPDKNIGKVDFDKVFSHINLLYHSLSSYKGKSRTLNESLDILSKDGKKYNFKYLRKYITEIGITYISHGYVVYFFNHSEKEAAKKGFNLSKNLNYKNEKMKLEFDKYKLNLFKEIESEEGVYFVIKKEKRFINLGDVLLHLNNKIPPEHIAWILSSIYNYTCFLHYNNIMHGGIMVDNIFIDPITHEIRLIGGWAYSKENEGHLSLLSQSAYNLASSDMLKNKTAELKLDSSMIKLLGRTLLGDKAGIKLQKEVNIPKPLVNWLLSPNKEDIFSEYTYWGNNVLIDSFGKRKFVVFNISVNDIYL